MALDIMGNKGVPLDRQQFTWRDVVRTPYSKLDDDAFTRVRVILMNGIESEALRFSHACSRMNRDLQLALARLRQVEQHQQTLVNWLNPPDQSPLETTIGFEQVAIEVTASVAQHEPDSYLAQVYRFGMLEDFDHMYRFAALMDRVMGKDANNLLQSYTDILPGRPTVLEHGAAEDNLREPYDRRTAHPLSKLHQLTIVAAEFQTHDYYMTIGPMFADPVARQMYAEIASIEEQHVTQYECLGDPTETWLEKLLLHECNEVYNYYGCMQSESNARVKSIWERFLDYELGHLHFAMELYKQFERKDPAEILPQELPEPIAFESHREFVRDVLRKEVSMRAFKTQIVIEGDENPASIEFRQVVNADGSPSEKAAAGYRWVPGTELTLTGQAKGEIV